MWDIRAQPQAMNHPPTTVHPGHSPPSLSGEAEPSLLGLLHEEPERAVRSPEGLVQGLRGKSEGRTRPGVTVPTEEETPP